MIFYFSGTGNSQFIATQMSQEQTETLISMSQAIQKQQFEYDLPCNEKVTFVFPIYHFTAPPLVIEFIRKLTFNHQTPHQLNVVVSYGHRYGEVAKQVMKEVEAKNWKLHHFYAIHMPDNRFKSSRQEIHDRLNEAKHQVKKMNQEMLEMKQASDINKRVRVGWVTQITSSLLQNVDEKMKTFEVNEDCISCKICERICPVGCIKVDQKPKWLKKCHTCLACVNYCPKSAITIKQRKKLGGRYTHPDILWHHLNKN